MTKSSEASSVDAPPLECREDSVHGLPELESEAIEIIREGVAAATRPVMLYSIGKDSSVLLHLARKAFWPAPPPMPLLHVDTTWKFREMIGFRDRVAAEAGVELVVHTNRDGLAAGVTPFSHGPARYTEVMKTVALRQALDAGRHDIVFVGARRDEEKSRAKERVFSLRGPTHRWDPRAQRPEPWNLYNTRLRNGESLRVSPLSNWTEADIWRYVAAEENPGRVPVPRGRAPRRAAGRAVDHGGRRASAARTGRGAGDAPRPLPHAGMLSAHRRDRERRGHARRDHRRDGGRRPLRAPGTAHRSRRRGVDGTQEARGLLLMPPALRFVLCGGVDDGKSTLFGRILYDGRQVFADELERVAEDSRRYGTRGDATDLALLVDGLRDEREQGITIDVAHRVFETPRRRFMVADAPGHEQYTRNMATGASTADLAVVLADARKGVLPQTARHTRIAAMFGVRHIVLAVNKMDLVGWNRGVFESIAAKYWAVAKGIGVAEVRAIPVCAPHRRQPDPARARSRPGTTARPCWTTWRRWMSRARPAAGPSACPSQYVNRPNADFRGYCGRVASGTVSPGDRVVVSPAGTGAEVESIVAWRGTRETARRGDSVTLTLRPAVDVARGDVIAAADDPLEVADQFQARILWMGDEPLRGGAPVPPEAARPRGGRHRDPDPATAWTSPTGAGSPPRNLELNDLGVVNLATTRPVPFAPFDRSRALGGFILIDRADNATVGAGTITFPLMRAANLKWRDFDIDGVVRARMKRQRARCLWLTGLSASGKSTIANLLERRLVTEGRHTYLLDGDNLRHGLNRDLGFTEADRVENIRRVAEVARLMVDAGLIVIASFISPFRSEREFARGLFEPGDFMEIFVDASVEACAARDPKGLYARAMRGEIRNFTGIDSPYERPERPDVRLDTEKLSPEECVELVVRHMESIS